MNKLNEELKNQAIAHGLCEQWQSGWQNDKTAQKLINMYKRGIDFCIKNDYPSVEYIKQHFSTDILRENLIYVDETVDIATADSGVFLFFGSCSGSISIDQFSVATIYVRHDCELTINANGFSKVFIRLYENAKVNVHQCENASVFVYSNSNNVSVKTDGIVNIRELFNH